MPAYVRFFQFANSSFAQENALVTTSDRTGFAKGVETLWLLGPTKAPMYRWAAPFTLVPSLQGWVGIYNGSSFASVPLGGGHTPSAVTWGVSGAVWVATVENDLYQISVSGNILTHATVDPYAGQNVGVSLGISSLLWWQGGLYAASAFNGLLAKLSTT